MKTIQSGLLYCAALLLLAVAAPVQAQFTFTTNNGTITITGYTGPGGTVTIPATTNGLPVTSIGDNAFDFGFSLTNVSIPYTVTNIGDGAFQLCSRLTNLELGTNVTSIGNNAFFQCALTSVTLPDSVIRIGYNVFGWCGNLTSVTFGANVASIGDNAFVNCINLTGVMLPGSVTSIGENAFAYCFGLTNVTILGTDTNLGDYAFAWCNNLTGVYFLGNAPSADSTIFTNDSSVTVYYLPGTTGWGSTFAEAPTSTWNPPLGSLQATILPAAAITVGAQWRVDDGAWQGSGATVSNLLVGEHTVSFSPATGWMSPASQSVLVNSNEVATVTGAYLPNPFNFAISDGAITITGYTGTGGTVTIPDTINGLPVTSIGSATFQYCTSLTNITIGASATSIGDYAFEFCANLTSITIGTNVTDIGDYAFAWCTSLTSFTIPNSVTNIGEAAIQSCPSLRAIMVGAGNPAFRSVAGVLFTRSGATLIEYPAGKTGTQYTIPNSVVTIGDYAFQSCTSLTNIVIGASVSSIGDWAFQNCVRLTSVTIPTRVNSIGEGAFQNCYRLTGATIPNSVTSIGGNAFAYCSSLAAITVAANNPAYSSVAGVLFNRDRTTLIECPAGKGGSYTIPNGVTSIGYAAFNACASLTSVKISNSVTNIGDYAFESCVSVTNVTIGANVTSIGGNAFAYCFSLSAIMVAANNPVYSSVAGVLFNQNQTTLVEYPQGKAGSSYTVPSGVTSIGEAAFEFCGNLTSLTIPASVASVGVEAFAWCNNLAVIFFQGNAPGTGWDPSNGDNNLAVYYLPDTTGWSSTFAGIPTTPWNSSAGLLQVTILPSAAGSAGAQWQVDNGTWQGSGTTMHNLSLGNHTVSFSPVAGWMPPASQNVSVNSNEVASASGTYVPTPFNYTINDGAITITGYTGSGGTVAIPGAINGWPVTSVGYAAFQNCASLTNVTIPDSVVTIGDYTFQSCNHLTNITIGASVTNIGEGAFNSCASLRAFTVAASNPAYRSVAGVLFNLDQTMLIDYPQHKAGGSYTIPGSVINIGDGAFNDCVSVTNLTIGTNVTSIGEAAFESCGRLTSITIPNRVISLGDYAFNNCAELKGVMIPNSVTSIGEGAFAWCASLSAIIVAANNPAFISVAGVLFDKTQTTLVEYPAGKTNYSYTVPNTVTNIGSWAFESCNNLTSATVGASVTSIGDFAFAFCNNLIGVTLGTNVTSIGNSAFLYCYSLTTVMIGNNVTSLGDYAFDSCNNLTSVTIGTDVTSIGQGAFAWCNNLTVAFFQGNAPSADSTAGVFGGDTNATAYYLAGTAGWGATFGGIPTALWNPQVWNDASFGVRTNCFGFNLTGPSNQIIVVEACTNLFHPLWQPVHTNTLTGAPLYFSDPQWTNHPTRFYRVRSP